MAQESTRATALRACGLVEPGLDPSFDRLARLAVGVTRAPICSLSFGDEPGALLKGYWGPPDLPLGAMLPPRPFYAALLEGPPGALASGDIAGAVVRTPAGVSVGAVCARTSVPRTWTQDALDALSDIARLAENELAVRASRHPDEQTSAILEAISDAFVFLDRDWCYRYVNRKAAAIFHRSASELVGKHIWTEFPDGVGQRFYHAYHRALEDQMPARIEEYYPPWNRWFENRIYPTRDGLAIFFVDVTERRREEAQKRRDAEVRAQAERMAHLGYWAWDVATNRVTWSPQLYRIYGLEESTFVASFDGYLERVHPADRKHVRQTIEGALRDRLPVTFDERVVRPGGEVRHLHSWANVSVGEDDQVRQMFGACLDVTELLVLGEGLRRTEEWLGAALRGTRVAVWEWNVRTNDVRWSEGAERTFHLEPAELGRSFDAYLDRVHPEDRNQVVESLRAAVERGGDLYVEHRIVASDGAVRWIVGRGTVYPDAAGRAERVLGTVVDVTECHEAEEERCRLLENLRHAQKMEALGRLAAGVAHDFNNYLTIVQTGVHVALRDPSLGEAARESMAGIQDAAQRASVLVRQLLGLSRGQVLELSALDLNEVVEEASPSLRRLLPANVELVVSLGEHLGPVRSDRAQLGQVLLNLVVNARDAMTEGGQLTIATRAEDHHAALEVRDTGPGMTDDVKARIFEPFFTTKSDGRGTGLGLSTVYGVVTKSGGTIDVASAPGAGTAFTVRFPVAGGA